MVDLIPRSILFQSLVKQRRKVGAAAAKTTKITLKIINCLVKLVVSKESISFFEPPLVAVVTLTDTR